MDAGEEGASSIDVLIADDDDMVTMLMEHMLGRIQRVRAVTTVGDGQEALDALTGPAPFHIALIDLAMPTLEGDECVQRLRAFERQHAQRRSTRVYAVTASGDEAEVRAMCLAAGFDDVFCKPVTFDQLNDVIAQYTPRPSAGASSSDASAAPLAPSSSAATTAALLAEPTSHSVLIVDDNELVVMLMEHMLQKSPQIRHHDAVGDGQAALEALTAGSVRYTLALVDLSMPVMDGYECTRRVREFERSSDAPRVRMIAVSASCDEPEVHAECLAAGFDGVIKKPLTFEQLQELLELGTAA
jgi:two-component system sensor histidine kinase/response regulator